MPEPKTSLKEKSKRQRLFQPHVLLKHVPEGGIFGLGYLQDVSVITRGEALGHGFWIDRDFLQQVADAINAEEKGVKARFTHPSLSGDGLGTYLGRVVNARVEGDQVLAELHFAESGTKSPDGNLVEYILGLAAEDPRAFGFSIVFWNDPAAEEDFRAEHTRDGQFISPDPDNQEHYPHVRLKELAAADLVDEPAANPDGLFHRQNKLATELYSLASYALGVSEQCPEITRLDVHPQRVREFVARFLSQEGLQLLTEKQREEELQKARQEGEQAARELLGRFVDQFGSAHGVEWFREGLSFEQARERHYELLRRQAEATGDDPASFLGEEPVSQATAAEAEPHGVERVIRHLKTVLPRTVGEKS